ncbi:uncharacterized protein G2W53_041775 [Senna tora]|uniref:Uncharacterized protein n=1 Tax=Senna tora TaxID=362788 RepID=A0A834SSM5_9FABA|nr:uncharacterized protein G2W53_041775 [Senna tora]
MDKMAFVTPLKVIAGSG